MLDKELEAFYKRHIKQCKLGSTNCNDCLISRSSEMRSLLEVARFERNQLELVIDEFGDLCVYCGDFASQLDHLLPRTWTGNETRKFVPTVPACADCNRRLSDHHAPTIKERCDLVYFKLCRKWCAKVNKPEASLKGVEGSLLVSLEARRFEKETIRRRLLILDAGGISQVSKEILNQNELRRGF